jgi:predicted alpha/beta-fold hydrolase
MEHVRERLKRFPGSFYSRMLNNSLREFLRRNYDVLKQETHYDVDAGLQSSNITEFERAVVIPMHRLSHETFYAFASSAQHVKNITVPFVSLVAADDPLCAPESVPIADCHENTVFASSVCGGHTAHLQWNGESALDQICIEVRATRAQSGAHSVAHAQFVEAVLVWRNLNE